MNLKNNKILFLNHARDKKHMRFMDNLFKLHTLYPIIEDGDIDFQVLWVGSSVETISPELDWKVFNKVYEYRPSVIILYGWGYKLKDIDKKEYISYLTLYLLKTMFKVKIIPLLFDQAFINFSESDNLVSMCDFAFTHEMRKVFVNHTKFPDKHIIVPPTVTKAFNGDVDTHKDINVLFIGGFKGRYPEERMKGIESLRLEGIEVFNPSGRTGASDSDDFISNESITDYTKRAKIVINWTRHISGAWHQAKARCFEATLAGALLISEECEAVNYFFKPNVDYITFNNEEDLVEKVKYYLTHEVDRIRIAKNGWNVANKKYSSESIRKEMMDKINSVSYFDIKDARYSLALNSTYNEKRVAKMYSRKIVKTYDIDHKRLDESLLLVDESYNSIFRRIRFFIEYIGIYHNPFIIRTYVPLVKYILPTKVYNFLKKNISL